MTVFLEFRTPCALCGYRLRGWQCRTIRINKHSLRTTDRAGLGAYDRACPECSWPADGAPWTFAGLGRADRVKVDAARARRGWEPLPGQVSP
jgi:hypothetical protein